MAHHWPVLHKKPTIFVLWLIRMKQILGSLRRRPVERSLSLLGDSLTRETRHRLKVSPCGPVAGLWRSIPVLASRQGGSRLPPPGRWAWQAGSLFRLFWSQASSHTRGRGSGAPPTPHKYPGSGWLDREGGRGGGMLNLNEVRDHPAACSCHSLDLRGTLPVRQGALTQECDSAVYNHSIRMKCPPLASF